MERVVAFRGVSIVEPRRWVYGNLTHYPLTDEYYINDIRVFRSSVGMFSNWYDVDRNSIFEGDRLELVDDAGDLIEVVCRFSEIYRTVKTTDEIESNVLIQGFYFYRKHDSFNSLPIRSTRAGESTLERVRIIGTEHEDLFE